jgi:hypothetical protein
VPRKTDEVVHTTLLLVFKEKVAQSKRLCANQLLIDQRRNNTDLPQPGSGESQRRSSSLLDVPETRDMCLHTLRVDVFVRLVV